MLRRVEMIAAIAILLLVQSARTLAQNSSANVQNAASPAATPAAPSAADQTDKKDSATQKAAPKPKKVWTNDDMDDLHQNSTVSVVGTQKKGARSNNYYSPPPGQSEYMVKMYRQQIDQLQAQADAIDKQISNLQDAKSGKTVDSTRKYDPWGGKQGDWDSQIAQLQKSKDNILKQIDSAEAQIRKLNP